MPLFPRIGGVIGGIIGRFRRRRTQAPPIDCYVWTYDCTWVVDDTGRELASQQQKIELRGPQSHQRASREARQRSLEHPPACIERIIRSGHAVRLRCRRAGPILPCP